MSDKDQSRKENTEKESTQDETFVPDEKSDSSEEGHEGEGKSKTHRKLKKDKSQELIEELKAQLEEMKDKHLRLQAEFDNFRKRTLKEKSDLIKSASETVLSKIIIIVDDFDRALGTMADVPEDDPAKIGFLLIHSKFKEFLTQNQVTEIEALGLDFDVDLHEAITKIPAPSEEQIGKIVDVIQKGYQLNGKVIRYAKVVIGE